MITEEEKSTGLYLTGGMLVQELQVWLISGRE